MQEPESPAREQPELTGVWPGRRKGPQRDREGMPGMGRVLGLVIEAREGVGISGWRGCNPAGMVLSKVGEFGALRLCWESGKGS